MPILNYDFIRAKPQHMSSNCNYMELFIGDKKDKEEGSQLAQLTAICKFTENISAKQLFGVTEEQFSRRCNMNSPQNNFD